MLAPKKSRDLRPIEQDLVATISTRATFATPQRIVHCARCHASTSCSIRPQAGLSYQVLPQNHRRRQSCHHFINLILKQNPICRAIPI
jgi:hypothetical protein